MISAGVTFRQLDRAETAHIMPTMAAAFNPHFQEAWSLEQITNAMFMPKTRVCAVLSEGNYCGFALFRTVLDEAELLLIGVHPDYQKRGLGAGLLAVALQITATDGAKKMFIEVRAGNVAMDFYRRHGFSVIGERPHYYRSKCGESFNAITMCIDIS